MCARAFRLTFSDQTFRSIHFRARRFIYLYYVRSPLLELAKRKSPKTIETERKKETIAWIIASNESRASHNKVDFGIKKIKWIRNSFHASDYGTIHFIGSWQVPNWNANAEKERLAAADEERKENSFEMRRNMLEINFPSFVSVVLPQT